MGCLFIPHDIELSITRNGDLDCLTLKSQSRTLCRDSVELGTIGSSTNDRLILNHEASHPLGFIIASILHGALLDSMFDYRAELVLGGLQNLSPVSFDAGISLRYMVNSDRRVNVIARGLQVLIGDYLHTTGIIGIIESELHEAEVALSNYLRGHADVNIKYVTPGSFKELISFDSMLNHLDTCRKEGWSASTSQQIWYVEGCSSSVQDEEFFRLGRDGIVYVFKSLIVPKHVLERLDRVIKQC